MSRIAIIMVDAAGYPNRAANVAAAARIAGCDFIRVSPWDQMQEGASCIRVPDAWLPPHPAQGYAWSNWFRCHLHYVLGARLIPPADFYWCVEGDVSASPTTWLRLLDLTADLEHDGLWPKLTHRSEDTQGRNGWFSREDTPAWCDWYCLMALTRISARGLRVWEETAEETRNVFTELAAPSVLARAGMPIRLINRRTHESLYNCSTMKFNPGRAEVPVYRDPKRFQHPVKRDDPLVPV